MDLSGGRGLVALAARPSRPGARDRSEVAEAVYDVLRHLRRYRQYGESGVGPASRRLAILGLAATLGAQELAEGLDAAEAEWLQRVSRIDPATLPRAVRGSIPDWLDERLSAMDSPDTLIEALNRQASLDLRVNPLRPSAMPCWSSCSRAPVATSRSPCRIRPGASAWRPSGHQPLGPVRERQHRGAGRGQPAAGPAGGARRGEMIIDFCAGAGGKTLLLGALMRSTGRLYAFDVSAARLARAKPRLPAADCPMWFRGHRQRERHPHQGLAGASACWSTRRAAASARCAAIPT